MLFLNDHSCLITVIRKHADYNIFHVCETECASFVWNVYTTAVFVWKLIYFRVCSPLWANVLIYLCYHNYIPYYCSRCLFGSFHVFSTKTQVFSLVFLYLSTTSIFFFILKDNRNKRLAQVLCIIEMLQKQNSNLAVPAFIWNL